MDKMRQPDSSRVMWHRLVRGSAAVAVVLLALCYVRYMLAVPFIISDDEGYALLSLKHYSSGEQLYTQVFSQYGPFYFLFQRALFGALHLPMTFDAGRWVAGSYWVAACAFGGVYVYRLSKSLALGLAAFLAEIWLERVLSFEPNHPQELVLVLVMASCCASVNPGPVSLLFLGAAGAALVFTKINIGVLFLAAALTATVCVLPDSRLRRVAGGLLLVAMLLAPVVLMQHLLLASAMGYCVIGILAGVSVVVAGMGAKVYSQPGPGRLRYIATGALSAAALIVGTTMFPGLPLRELLNAVVLAPLHHSDVSSIPLAVTRWMVLLALLMSLCVACLYCFPDRCRKYASWVDALKCVAGLAVVLIWVQRDMAYIFPLHWSFAFAPAYALLPLILLPRANVAWKVSDYFPRIFIAAMSAMQLLQAYPVAGSQVHIGAAPFLLWAFVCIYDGADGLRDVVLRSGTTYPPVRAAAWAGMAIVVLMAAKMVRRGVLHRSYPYPASQLAGSGMLHITPASEATFEALSKDIRANCDVLFSIPGMARFNFWSGVPTPDGFNLTTWLRGVPLKEQQHTLQLLESNPGACVLYSPIGLSIWGAPDAGADSLPLAYYILHKMPTAMTREGFEIRVSPDRRTPWAEQTPASTR